MDIETPRTGETDGGGPPARAVYRSAAIAIAIAWSLRLIGLVSVLVLARLLTPRDFGIVALATSVLALVDIFSALGLRQALLRIARPDRAHYDTAWTLQLLVLAFLAVVLVAVAPLAARFYAEPALGLLIPILAASFVIDGLANIATVDFERNLDLGRDLRMRVSVRLASFFATLSAALILQNYWALILGMMLQSILNAAASYLFHPFRPRFSLSKRAELLGVSLWMFLASASQTIHILVEKLVVGRIATRNLLGAYSVSRDLSSIFTEEISTALNRVTFVTTAQTGQPLSADPGRLSAMLGAYALIAAPLGLGLAATADDVVPVLLGPQWTAAPPYLAILAPACACYAVYKLVISTLQASGDARLAGLISASGAMLMVAAAAITAFAGKGPQGIALSGLCVTAALLCGGILMLARKAEANGAAMLAAVARPFLAGLVMMLVLRQLDTAQFGPFASLMIKAPAGALLFALAAAGLWRLQGRPEGAENILLDLAKRRFIAPRARPANPLSGG